MDYIIHPTINNILSSKYSATVTFPETKVAYIKSSFMVKVVSEKCLQNFVLSFSASILSTCIGHVNKQR